jgi:tRNA nucleotidyltransferase/poly(A) polymerase
MEICKELKDLAIECNKKGYKLYIVGGYVRDSLLGLECHDIDLASNIDYEEISQICKKLKFKVVPINKTLGTLHISTPSGEFEYTHFRSESYASHGSHTPNKITFVKLCLLILT